MSLLRARFSEPQEAAEATCQGAQVRVPTLSADRGAPVRRGGGGGGGIRGGSSALLGDARGALRQSGSARRHAHLRSGHNPRPVRGRSSRCNGDQEVLGQDKAVFLGGVRSGVNGTPSFFIDGERFEGSFAYEDLLAAIDARLHASLPR